VIVTRANEERWAELMAEVDERVAQLLAWRDNGDMPGRVCRKPQDSWGHFCLFAGHCFEDAPAWDTRLRRRARVGGGAGARDRVRQVKAQRREIAASTSLLKGAGRRSRSSSPGSSPRVSGTSAATEVRRSERAGRRSFDFARADLDGRFPDGLDRRVHEGR
jgi:hypothetical protein